jgi:GNAT superfamily N-acetyltransferase
MIHIAHLFEHPQYVDQVAIWIHAEFWADKQVHTPESLGGLLRLAVAADAIPLSRLAMVDGVPVGTVNLIENDDENRRHLRPWLAALYVVPERRRQGVGSALVRDLRQCAAMLGIRTLYLGTDNPGFYGHLGAMIHEQVTGKFAIMQLATRLS